jgi:hypothetical protein
LDKVSCFCRLLEDDWKTLLRIPCNKPIARGGGEEQGEEGKLGGGVGRPVEGQGKEEGQGRMDSCQEWIDRRSRREWLGGK